MLRFSRLLISIFGSRPKCSSNADFLNRVCEVFRVTSKAMFNAPLIFSPASIFVCSISFSIPTPRSTSPVGLCLYGVPYIRLIWCFLRNSLNVRPVNAVALSVLNIFGIPFKFRHYSKNLTTVFPSVVLQKLAVEIYWIGQLKVI